MILHANFTRNQNEVTTDELFQWDTGQQLCIEGLTGIDASTEVHFAHNRMIQAIVKTGTFENDKLTVDIPNEFLQSGGIMHGKAWIYVTESNAVGRTIKTIKIPIVPRKRPNDYVSPADPDSKGIVEQALEILRDGTKVSYVTAEAVDNATETGKIYHTTVGSSKALIIPVSGTLSQVQFRLDRDGKIYSRRRSRLTTESPFPAWGSWTDISTGVDPEVIQEIVAEIIAARGDFDNLSEAIASKVPFVNVTSADNATENGVWYQVKTNTENYALFAVSTAAQQTQFRILSTGSIGIRRRYVQNDSTFPAWGSFERIGWARTEIEGWIDDKIDAAIGGVLSGEY